MIVQTKSRIAVINTLVAHGGSLTDPSGLVTPRLLELTGLEYSSVGSFSLLLHNMEKDGMLIRDTRGKRTYEITLGDLPEGWPVQNPPVAPEPPEAPDTPEDSPRPTEATGEATGATPGQVADALLARVAQILAQGEPDQRLQAERNEIAIRLASVLEENGRLRRTTRELGEELQALRHEARGLRERLRATEANLQAAVRSNSHAVRGEVEEQIRRFMSEAPRNGA